MVWPLACHMMGPPDRCHLESHHRWSTLVPEWLPGWACCLCGPYTAAPPISKLWGYPCITEDVLELVPLATISIRRNCEYLGVCTLPGRCERTEALTVGAPLTKALAVLLQVHPL